MLMAAHSAYSALPCNGADYQRQQCARKLCAFLCSHNKGAIQRLFLGSTSDYCVKHCAQPLIVIR